MLGLYSCTDRGPRELAEFARLTALHPAAEPVIRGPLAVAAPGDELGQAREGDLTCLMEGALYGRATQGRVMGLEAGDDAQFVARAHLRFGTDALTRLRGRYATVLWDDARREGVIACDLLATRELFVCRTAGTLVFATECATSWACSRPALFRTRSASRRGWVKAPAPWTARCMTGCPACGPASSWR